MDAVMKEIASVKVEDVAHDYRPFLVIHKDGRIQRFIGTATVPASTDPLTGVESKDVVICPETGLFVRLYKPSQLTTDTNADVDGEREEREKRVPVVVYFHGGGFCVETASSPVYHHYLNALCSLSQSLVVSVDYRRAPEHPLPVAYDDSWAALGWVGDQAEPWVRAHGDLSRVYMAGDSAGANIAHQMAKRLAKHPLPNLNLKGMVLVHPFFWGEDRIGSENLKMETGSGLAAQLWAFVCPDSSNGCDDPRINPAMDPDLGDIGGVRVMVCVAEHDALRDRGFHYQEALQKKSGGRCCVEVVETAGENHVFHLLNPASDNAAQLMNQIVAFINS